MEKLIIYQLLPRLFTNANTRCVPWGSLMQNGSGRLNDITQPLLEDIRRLGCNAVWYTGIIEHATTEEFPGIPADNPAVVKGRAGSPYAIRDYYDIAPELATSLPDRMKEFEALVERTHCAGMRVFIDFVPNHTARHYHSDVAPKDIRDFGAGDDTTKFFVPDNNYYYLTNQQFAPQFSVGNYNEFPAKATGNDCYSAFPGVNDWYETVKLNYGRDPWNGWQALNPVPDTWLKMLHILRFWASKGVDGFRCDMVFMVPREFWHWAIPQVKKDYPDIIFIGEIYDIALYRDFLSYCGFDYLYDKVGLYDTLVAIERYDWSAARITDAWQSVDGIGPRMLNFLENHDEVRFASSEFASDPRKALPYLVVSSMLSTGPFMLYFGQELGEAATDCEGLATGNHRTTIFDFWSYSTLRRYTNHGQPSEDRLTPEERALRSLYSRVLNLCNSEKAISEGSFFDLMYVNLSNPRFSPHRQFAFLRHYEAETLLIAVNFGAEPADVAINIPRDAFTMLDLPEGELNTTELLTDTEAVHTFSPDAPLRTVIPSYGAVILKTTNNVVNE